MKILFLEQFSELGGGQQCLLDLLPAVCERGWKALVAAPGSGPLFEAARQVGAETAVIKLGPYTSGSKTGPDALRFLTDTIRLSNWIARQDADMIFLSAPRPLVAAALWSRLSSLRTRFPAGPAAWKGGSGQDCPPHIFHAQHFLGKRYAVSLAGWALRHSHATVIADSEYVAAQYRQYVAPERMRVIYNGVSEIPFQPRRFFRDRFWKIGLIGRIAPMKGQADFLRAAALLPQDMINARFVICGAPMFAPPAYLEEVQRLATGLPVDFLGWRSDIATVLAGLDLLVVPSTSAEATTRVILEAFSAGVPVVAYSIGGIPEIIQDSRNGFLVPECQPEALARKILQVTYLDLQPLVARARADWESRYTVERYREEMIRVMDACATTT